MHLMSDPEGSAATNWITEENQNSQHNFNS